MFFNSLLVGLGGFAGSVCRYLLSSAVSGGNIPPFIGTFSVNIIGSLLIGILLAITGNGTWHYLAVVGFCGGFTTFSSFSAEAFSLFGSGQVLTGLLYAAGSVLLCIAAVWLGIIVTGKVITG